MLKNISIKAKLIVVVTLLSMLMTMIGVLGVLRLHSANLSLQSVYDNRLVAASQLAQVMRELLNVQLCLDVHDATVDGAEVQRHLDNAELAWQSYMSTTLTTEEQLLAVHFVATRDSFLRQDVVSWLATDHVRPPGLSPLKRDYRKVDNTLQALMTLQLQVGAQEFAQSREAFDRFRLLALFLLASGLLTGLGGCAWLVRSISRPLDYAVEIAEAVAGGDLTREIRVETTDEMGKLLNALRHMNISLRDIVDQVHLGTDAITTASCEIASGNLDLSNRTEHEAESLAGIASSLEQITHAMQLNVEHAMQASSLMHIAADTAQRSGAAMTEVTDAKSIIHAAVDSIASGIAEIENVAETARLIIDTALSITNGGAPGYSQAELFDEIRQQAERAKRVAGESRILIAGAVIKFDACSQLSREASHTITDVVGGMKLLGQLINEISAASSSQSIELDQINLAMMRMDATTQQNAVLVEQAAAAAALLNEQANALSLVVRVFRTPPSSTQLQAPSLAFHLSIA